MSIFDEITGQRIDDEEHRDVDELCTICQDWYKSYRMSEKFLNVCLRCVADHYDELSQDDDE
jgi:hypothetical protein